MSDLEPRKVTAAETKDEEAFQLRMRFAALHAELMAQQEEKAEAERRRPLGLLSTTWTAFLATSGVVYLGLHFVKHWPLNAKAILLAVTLVGFAYAGIKGRRPTKRSLIFGVALGAGATIVVYVLPLLY